VLMMHAACSKPAPLQVHLKNKSPETAAAALPEHAVVSTITTPPHPAFVLFCTRIDQLCRRANDAALPS
jgi:hypothetical protein